jgi:hypothetical protein
MAYPTRVGILGVAASVFPVVYICIKLVGSQLGTGMAGQVAQVTQVSETQWDLNFLKYVYVSDFIVSDCCLSIVRQEQVVRRLSSDVCVIVLMWRHNGFYAILTVKRAYASFKVTLNVTIYYALDYFINAYPFVIISPITARMA